MTARRAAQKIATLGFMATLLPSLFLGILLERLDLFEEEFTRDPVSPWPWPGDDDHQDPS